MACATARAIRILAPMKVKLADDDPATANDRGNDEPARVFFRAVPVFDRSQVEPLPDRDPAPLEPPSAPITGDSHAHLIPSLDTLAAELGYRVCERTDTGAAGGWCDTDLKGIVIKASLAANAKVRVRVHELAHALGIGYEEHGRAQAEVLVDTVIFRPARSIRGLNAGRSVGDGCHRRGRPRRRATRRGDRATRRASP